MRWGLAIVLGLTAVSAGVTGCSTFNTSQSSSADENDRKITSQVKSALKRDPVYKFNATQVSTSSGVVQLSGFTPSDKAKHRAGEIAKNVEGVKDVMNNIVVQQ